MDIETVILKAKAIDELKKFYEKQLGLSLLHEQEHSFRVKVGGSVLGFEKSDKENQPFYHLAFHIPGNFFHEAKSWARERVSLNEEDDQDEVVFPRLQARSMYFHDPAGNIVELIARDDVMEMEEQAFSAPCVLGISEISLTVENVFEADRELERLHLRPRDHDPIKKDGLNFIGDHRPHSYLLLVEPGRRWIFSNQKSEIHPVRIHVSEKGWITVDDQGLLSVDQS